MLIRIEFYRYKECIALYNERQFSSKELKKQLVEAELAEYLGEKDNFIEVLREYGWRDTTIDDCAQYWYDRDVQRLFRYEKMRDKKGKSEDYWAYKEVKPCLNFRIKMRARFKEKQRSQVSE